MNRRNLLAGVAMTPSEKSVGRYLRAPEGHEMDSSDPENNDPGNEQPKNDPSQNQNNGGQNDLSATFWGDQTTEEDTNESSAPDMKAVGEDLNQLIENASFEPVFTAEIQEQLASGDFEGANKALATQQQATMRQTLTGVVKLVGAAMQQMQADSTQRIKEFDTRSNQSRSLIENFPEAKDPAARPVIQQIYSQALKNTDGDTEKAVEQTRSMLQIVGTKAGLGTPPRDPNDLGGDMSENSQNLVDSLMDMAKGN